jgi:hypothetical protein
LCGGQRSGRLGGDWVSAWANANRRVLGQEATEEKSNEITAIPKLLALLDLHGCIVTLDAMGCQRAIAERIVEQGGDYVLGLKGNQGSLHEAVEEYLTTAQAADFKNVPYRYAVKCCLPENFNAFALKREKLSDGQR